jgi:hypothetical protein
MQVLRLAIMRTALHGRLPGAFVRAEESLAGKSGIPGIQKVQRAVRNQRPVSAAAYFKTPASFGFTGVFRRLARDGARQEMRDERLRKGWLLVENAERFRVSHSILATALAGALLQVRAWAAHRVTARWAASSNEPKVAAQCGHSKNSTFPPVSFLMTSTYSLCRMRRRSS